MAEIKEAIRRFLTVDYGSGYGSGSGYGDGDGYGSGSGYGYGDGYGSGYGYGYGSGDGSGSGSGDGSGYGYGYGSGNGSGSGSGSGDGVMAFNGQPVYMIDSVATIIKAVFGNYAKGYILNKDLTLSPCYIAKEGRYFAHGDTLADAVRDAHEKSFEGMSEDERIEEFWQYHEKGVKYPAMDFYDWHHRLTGSCVAGRKYFAANNGVNLETDTYTVEEFVEICKNSYGGDIIRRLLEE